MSEKHPPLRFDHREIAVIFSLFVFISLLMFTVGIVVGKGLTQTKYEQMILETQKAALQSGKREVASPNLPTSGETPLMETQGSMITSPPKADPAEPTLKSEKESSESKKNEPAENTERKPSSAENTKEQSPQNAAENTKEQTTQNPAEHPAESAAEIKQSATTNQSFKKNDPTPLKLVPKTDFGLNNDSLKEPNSKFEAEALLKNPKISALLESSAPNKKPQQKRKVASLPPLPKSLPAGPFTVQIGSYPTKKSAVERVESLKKLGFPYAYLSVKQFGSGKEIWYRVWLGYFSSISIAEKSGHILQKHGEINNYLVRKSDAEEPAATSEEINSVPQKKTEVLVPSL